MYKRTVWQAGEYRITKKSHSYRYPGGKRGRREKRTPEAMERENRKQRRDRLQLLILANFQKGDLWITLPYQKEQRPESIEEAKDRFRRFIRKLGTAFRKLGYEICWIVTTERGKRGGCHHHMIINNLPGITELISELWPYAKKVIIEHLYEDGEYESLAEYIIKTETKEDGSGTYYSRSRNLIVPEGKTEIIEAKTFYDEPKPVKGYEILKDSITNGTNPFTGYPYQRYIMKKIRTGTAGGEEKTKCQETKGPHGEKAKGRRQQAYTSSRKGKRSRSD